MAIKSYFRIGAFYQAQEKALIDDVECTDIVDNSDPTNPVITGGGGGIPSLTATQIAYGDGSNLMTSSALVTTNGTTIYLKNDADEYLNFKNNGGVLTGRVINGSLDATYESGLTKYRDGVMEYNNSTVFQFTEDKLGINTNPTVALDVVVEVKVTGMQQFANRTAALAGGLTSGMMYSLPISGDNKVICIV